MLFTFFLILLLTRVSSCDRDCVWDTESGMSAGEILFREIFLTPFGHHLETDPLPDLCDGVKPAGISFLKYWGDATLSRLPSCDCIWHSESSKTIGEDLFRAIFWTPFGLGWNLHGRIKPPDAISFWQYWDDPVFIFLDFLFAVTLAILMYICVMWLALLVTEEKPTKDVGTQTELTVNKATQTEGDSGQFKNSWWLLEHTVFTRKRKSKY